MSTVGILSTVGYHDARGGYHEYRRGYSVLWDIMMHVGDIMSTVGGVQYRGGIIFCYLSTLMVLNTPTLLMIFRHMYHDIPHGTQITKDDLRPWY